MTHHDNKLACAMPCDSQKRAYVKPSMKVYPLIAPSHLLQSSSSMPIDPTEAAEQWYPSVEKLYLGVRPQY